MGLEWKPLNIASVQKIDMGLNLFWLVYFKNANEVFHVFVLSSCNYSESRN